MKKIITLLLIVTIITSVQAQDTLSTLDRQSIQNNDSYKPGKSKFLLRGFFFTGFDAINEGDASEYNFIGGGINPVLLFRQSERLFFEAEFEGEYTHDDGFKLGLGYANASFVLTDFMTIRAGLFLLPFGTFTEKLHPAWINKAPDAPLGFGHDGIAPTGDAGIELRGAFYSSTLKWNYQLYVVNGPQLKTGEDEPEEAGMLLFGYMSDNNKNKTVGGRIGLLPFSNQMLEIGASAMTGVVGTDGSEYEGVRANLYAVDLSFVKSISAIKSIIDIKGQYNYTRVDDANYPIPDDPTGSYYDFNNVSYGYYAQLAIRPALISNDFFRKLELVGRYSILQTPEGSLWEQNPKQWTLGLNYWYDWRTVVKVGYQTTAGLGDHDTGIEITRDLFYVRLALGF